MAESAALADHLRHYFGQAVVAEQLDGVDIVSVHRMRLLGSSASAIYSRRRQSSIILYRVQI